MRLVGSAKLNFNLISTLRIGILQQKIESPSVRLDTFFLAEFEISQALNGRIVSNQFLHPFLVKIRVSLDR